MADTYKLQYDGMTLTYPGWNGCLSYENPEVAYNLYLQQQEGGTITADKLSGLNGEIVTLSNTPDAGYQFNSYGITGAVLTGNQFTFDGYDVSAQANFEEAVYTLTLQTDGHGTIAATKTTGHAGDTVTLSNTYKTYYRFNNYTQTGGNLNGSTFTFGNQNATAKANFKVNSFTATGGWEKGSNVVCSAHGNSVTTTKYIPEHFAVHGAHTGSIPASWYSTSNRWHPSNASSYKITLNPKMTVTAQKLKLTSYNNNPGFTGVSRIGSTYTQSQSWSVSNSTAKQTWNYNKSFTSNSQSTYSISGKLTAFGRIAAGVNYDSVATYIATATTGGWTATGYAP